MSLPTEALDHYKRLKRRQTMLQASIALLVERKQHARSQLAKAELALRDAAGRNAEVSETGEVYFPYMAQRKDSTGAVHYTPARQPAPPHLVSYAAPIVAGRKRVLDLREELAAVQDQVAPINTLMAALEAEMKRLGWRGDYCWPASSRRRPRP